MIGRAKAFAKRHWPALRLRTILFCVLLTVAAVPVLSAVFLRVYENTLVRQTEAELVAQGAALSSAASVLWREGDPRAQPPLAAPVYQPEALSIDLSSTPVLPARPPPSLLPAADEAEAEADAAAARLAPILRGTTLTTLASVVLTDRNGRVLLGSEAGRSYAALPELRTALAGTPATVLRRNGQYHPRYSFEWLSRASALRIEYARPIIRDGRVVGALLLSRSPRALFRGVYQDRGKILLGLGFVCVLVLVLSGLVSRGITRPIEALSQASRRVAEGRGEVPETPPTAAIEIRVLYEDFRAMAHAIARRSLYLRDFAAAVSHEFKTPLAGIRGATELLQDHHDTMSGDELRRFLANISSDTDRLSRPVTRLLDLARADMARPDAGSATDLEAVIRRVKDAFLSPGLVVEIDPPQGLPRVAVPEGVIETVLTTLLENGRQEGAKSIALRARAAPSGVVMEVMDDGRGVAEPDRERLFEPFFTSRREAGGTGLGLSIARSLLTASHATIAYQPQEKGASFRVVFPVSR